MLNHFGCFRFERGRLYPARNDTELMQIMDFTDSMQVCYQVTSIKSVAFIRLCASRGAGRSIIGGANIHIFVFCTINFC